MPERKLADRLRDAIRLRGYSIRTEKAYLHWYERFVRFHKLRHPARSGRCSDALDAAAIRHTPRNRKVDITTQRLLSRSTHLTSATPRDKRETGKQTHRSDHYAGSAGKRKDDCSGAQDEFSEIRRDGVHLRRDYEFQNYIVFISPHESGQA